MVVLVVVRVLLIGRKWQLYLCVCEGEGGYASSQEEKEEVVYNTELSFPNRNVSFPKVLEREKRREK